LKVFSKIFFILFFLAVESSGTHIVGGEITYRDLGGFNYEVTLKLYRDCHNGEAAYDDPTYITVFNSAGQVVNLLEIAFPGSKVLPILPISPCLSPPTDVCVEEAVFVDTINLPPIPGGYQLSYERCCRNKTLINIINPLETGATYYTVIPDTTVVLSNSSPKYINFPPIYICANEKLDFDHSAFDLDGDSLVYELCTPYLGGDANIPYPVPSHSPPYSFVTYYGSYNANDPLGYDPAIGAPLTIDPQTGRLTGFPNTIGQFVVGVCVSEYRNGVLLTVNKRDFQFNVTKCPPISVAALPTNIKECGYTINFQNQSINAFNNYWDFGDHTTLADTSLLFSPSYTFPDTGTYIVTLIVNRGLLCADTATSLVHIYHSIAGGDFQAGNVCLGDSVQFKDFSLLTEGPETSRKWYFGDGLIDSVQSNPLHLYTLAKNYDVTFVAYNKNGCTDTVNKTITIYPIPISNAGNDTSICNGVTFQLHGTGGGSYLWNNTSELSCTACSNPFVSPAQSSYYGLTVTSAFNCKAKDSVYVTVRPVIIPSGNFTYSGRCSDHVMFYGMADNFDYFCRKNVKWQWDFGDGTNADIQNPTHQYSGLGPYIVSLKVSDDSPVYQETLTLLPGDSCLKNIFIPNTFTPNGDNVNDILYLRTLNVKKIIFRIYNRWGEEIFRTYDLHEGWDGTYKGEKLTPQVFVYQAQVVFYDDTEVVKKGNITLVE
jgi:gliding motility-associated-like protein